LLDAFLKCFDHIAPWRLLLPAREIFAHCVANKSEQSPALLVAIFCIASSTSGLAWDEYFLRKLMANNQKNLVPSSFINRRRFTITDSWRVRGARSMWAKSLA